MKAIYKKDKNEGLEIRDIEEPEIGEKEIKIRVKKAAVCGTDIHLYEWNNWCENVKAKNPMILGHEFCGEVVATGKQVTSIKVGDMVAAETHIPCGSCNMCKTGKKHICQDMKIVGVHTDGAFAEYAKIPEVCAWKLPESVSAELGAIYEPFGIAVHAVLKDEIAGLNVMVFGCGPIGLFAVKVAKFAGAAKIFAVDINNYRLNLAGKIGENVHTLNPEKEDVVTEIRQKTAGVGADVLIELSGSAKATQSGFEALTKSGWASLVGLHPGDVSLDLVNNIIYKETTVYGITGREMFDTWFMVDKIMRTGRLNIEDVITHNYDLEETEKAILKARQRLCGKVIINVD